jgi:hypothetical protein
LCITVDDEDYERLIQYKWRFAKDYKTSYFNVRGKVKGKAIYVGRFILEVTDKTKVVDHKDRNTLNNCRSNLRVISQGDNVRNSGRVKYAYVSVDCNPGSFRVRGENKKHIATYATKEEALVARDKLLIAKFGLECEYLTYKASDVMEMSDPVKLTKGSSSITKLKGVEKPLTRKYKRPSKEELHRLIWDKPVASLAKDIGCSDKCIEKWCKVWNVPKPPRGFWNKFKEGKLEGLFCPLPH